MQTTEQQVCPSCGNYTTLIDGECSLCKQRKGTIELIEQFQNNMQQVDGAFEFIIHYNETLEYYKKIIKETKYNKKLFEILGITFALSFMATIILIPLAIIIIVIGDKHSKKLLLNIEEAQNKLNECVNSYQIALTDISNCYNNSNKFIPIKYSAPLLVNEIKQILVNRRANSIQEALNIYETDLYQSKMLDSQNTQQAQLALIAGLSAISATANVVTAFNTRR